VATATVADLRDLEAKVERAMEIRGPRYIHVFVPCPLGWGSASRDTVRLARLVKETGLFPVCEAEHGEVVSVSKIRRRVAVTEYLKLQRRYAHLFKPTERTEVIERMQAGADRNIKRFDLLADPEQAADLPGEATDLATAPGEGPGPPVEPDAAPDIAQVLSDTHGSPR
jgi:pyruvate ferredoxin oxidoreductase beta subunit